MVNSSKLILMALILLSACPAYCQKKTQMERTLETQRIINAHRESSTTLTRDANAAMWMDVGAASDFPVPLFKGNQTKVMRTSVPAGVDTSKFGKQLILFTRDPATTVSQWYRRYLPGAGFKLDDKFPAQSTGGKFYMVRADSPKYNTMITIVPKDDAQGPGSQVTLVATPKQPEKK